MPPLVDPLIQRQEADGHGICHALQNVLNLPDLTVPRPVLAI